MHVQFGLSDNMIFIALIITSCGQDFAFVEIEMLHAFYIAGNKIVKMQKSGSNGYFRGAIVLNRKCKIMKNSKKLPHQGQ